MTVALCQCIKCARYLARNRLDDNTWINNVCELCANGGIPLAQIRGTLSDPLSIELLALLSEECGETTQRNSKIMRWGWDANFEGTTQRDKLESELGDILAATVLLIHNKLITEDGLILAMQSKLKKFREDALGPRQRLLHAEVPPPGDVIVVPL